MGSLIGYYVIENGYVGFFGHPRCPNQTGHLGPPIIVIDKTMSSNRTAIRIKRVYEEAEEVDGCRILVDRLWARGLSKEKAKVDIWIKEIAPSTELRRWYGHDPNKWTEFKRRYNAELLANPENVEAILEEVQKGIVTFLYSSKEEQLNNAVVLKEYIESIIDAKAV